MISTTKAKKYVRYNKGYEGDAIKQLHNLSEATEAFLTYSPLDTKGKHNLNRMSKLMAFLGDPQEKLKFVHIAGTSGKTSTAYFIRGFLEAAGQKTGLTVSPHIVAINERVQIGGLPLEESVFLAYANRFLSLVEKTDIRPTYFELLIALAYWVFAQEKVDYAVVETGIGGLLDSTNVVSRIDKVCAITDIGLDHTKALGSTLSQITTQKAGIIQPYNHVLIRQQNDEIMNVIAKAVHKQQATIKIVAHEDALLDLPHFQHRNWTLARAVFGYLKHRDHLPELTSMQLITITQQTPPGRWEIYHFKDKTIILDGAHNPQKLQALCKSLILANIHSAAVLANFMAGSTLKTTAELAMLQPITTHLVIPEFQGGQDYKTLRSVPAMQLEELAKQRGFSSELQPDIAKALQTLLQRPEKTLLITGSLYLVSALRPLVIASVKLPSKRLIKLI